MSNAGPSDASGAAFANTLLSGEAIHGTPTCAITTGAATCGAETIAGNKLSSTITALPANSSVSFSILASAAAAGSYTNTTTPSLTTAVSASNGITKTVRNVTSGTAASATSDTSKPGDVLVYTNTTGVALTNFASGDLVLANTRLCRELGGVHHPERNEHHLDGPTERRQYDGAVGVALARERSIVHRELQCDDQIAITGIGDSRSPLAGMPRTHASASRSWLSHSMQ